MDYEYRALSWRTLAWCDDKSFVSSYARLQEEGWEEHIRAYFENDIGGACIMRRSKDEPRLWTEKEIQKIAVMNQRGPRADGGWLGPPRPGSALNERVMQADLCGRLERRNTELQAAIDVVVREAKQDGDRAVPTLLVAQRLLYPLATKKEET